MYNQKHECDQKLLVSSDTYRSDVPATCNLVDFSLILLKK